MSGCTYNLLGTGKADCSASLFPDQTDPAWEPYGQGQGLRQGFSVAWPLQVAA